MTLYAELMILQAVFKKSQNQPIQLVTMYFSELIAMAFCISGVNLTCIATIKHQNLWYLEYHMIKNFGSKKFWQKGCCKELAKKTLANVDLHCQSTINSKMKPNKAIPNYTLLLHG